MPSIKVRPHFDNLQESKKPYSLHILVKGAYITIMPILFVAAKEKER
jgi:hypothetical protein